MLLNNCPHANLEQAADFQLLIKFITTKSAVYFTDKVFIWLIT